MRENNNLYYSGEYYIVINKGKTERERTTRTRNIVDDVTKLGDVKD